MKICVAQIKPVRGEVAANIDRHIVFIEQAINNRADTIVFPELSITGYEPGLAKQLATSVEDQRFSIFKDLSNRGNINICIGVPCEVNGGIQIGMIIFSPSTQAQLYSKQYLHADELPFFKAGQKQVLSFEQQNKLSLSICYELSVPAHAQYAFETGAEIYLSSVAKTAGGVKRSAETLSGIARKYNMTVLMANCVGQCDDFDCGGQSAAWNRRGELIAQLDDTSEGMMIVDTATEKLLEMAVPKDSAAG